MFPSSENRPFNIIADAERAWQTGDLVRAEELFKVGIAAYEKQEPDGLDFALGRYGAFFLAQNRKDDAARVLKQAIELKTDLPAIWSDYLGIVAERRDINSFKAGADLMASCLKQQIHPEFLLGFARSADREGSTAFAQQIALWVIEKSEREGDKEGRWAAIGDLGRILERADHLDEALKLWRDAFDEGSADPDTANRLSMHLERAKDYDGSIRTIREALTRQLTASAEESLRKRLVRCEEKVQGKSSGKANKRPDVAAYSVRKDSILFESLFQIRLKSSVNSLAILGNLARCIFSSKGNSTLVDIDLESGSESRRVENLPLLGETFFTKDGRGISIFRTAAVGQGPTVLKFLSSDGHVVFETSVPDATSNVALGPDLWYVGCRNGFLYAFGLDGRKLWAWETPGARNYQDNAYFRPCPYHVALHESFAYVASMENIYAVSSTGNTLWGATLPNESETRWEFTIPIDGTQAGSDPFATLQIPSDSPRGVVKAAYRRLALATHPDRNPNEADSTTKFRQIQVAYERILAGHVSGSRASAGITISMEFQGMRPTVSVLNANTKGVVAGSSQGQLYIFGRNGSLREARPLGDGSVLVAVRPDGTVGAAWCSNALLFFRDNRIINAAESVDMPRELIMLGDDVVLWRRNEVQVMNSDGKLVWAVEFSKSVSKITLAMNRSTTIVMRSCFILWPRDL